MDSSIETVGAETGYEVNKIYLEEGSPDLVSGLTKFFNEVCPNEIIMYRPDENINEPAYCKDGRVGHNKTVSKSLVSRKVVKGYDIVSVPKENGKNTVVVTIFLGKELPIPEDMLINVVENFDFDMFKYRPHPHSGNSLSIQLKD